MSSAPDPEPLRMSEQVEYELELAEGAVRVLSVRPVSLKAPVVTPRRMGRYAIELSIGHELIERVRFDFPGTAADEVTPGRSGKTPLAAPLTLSARAVARLKVQVPRSARVRRATLVDRGLETATPLEWPLPAPPKPSVEAPAVSTPTVAPTSTSTPLSTPASSAAPSAPPSRPPAAAPAAAP